MYMESIYMYVRLVLGVYGPYICIYTDIEACAQSRANIYIYTYTHTHTHTHTHIHTHTHTHLNLGAKG